MNHTAASDRSRSVTEIDVVSTTVGTVRCSDDGIVRLIAAHDHPLTGQEAEELMSAIAQAAGGRSVPVLVDARGGGHLTREARHVLTSRVRYSALAVALVIDSPVGRAFGMFLVRFNRPQVPTKLFSSEVSALDWLRGFLKWTA